MNTKWYVWEEDQTGAGMLYSYATRRDARRHVRRVRSNPFLKDWLVRSNAS